MNIRKVILMSYLLTGACCAAGGAETEYVITEKLNRRWCDQFVSYPFSADKGACRAGSLSLKGEDGVLPAQLYDVECWESTDFVKSARICFTVKELAPLATLRYKLEYSGGEIEQVEYPKKYKISDRYVEMHTARMGVRVPVGVKEYQGTAKSSDVPGPIAGLSLAGSSWFGGSSMYGSAGITKWSSELVDSGPVFCRTRSVYEYEGGQVLTVYVKALTGEETVSVDMNVAGELPLDGWRLLLKPEGGFRDAKNIYGIGSWMRESGYAVPADSGTNVICYLSPWAGDYWFPDSPAIIRLRRGEGAGPEMQLCVRDVPKWVQPEESPSWANFATWHNAWIDPPRMWSGWQSRRIPLFPDGSGGVRMEISLMAGERHWSMTSADDGVAVMDTFLRKEMTTHSNLPLLDEVKDMVLEWPDPRASGLEAGNADGLKPDSILDQLGNIDLFRMNEGGRRMFAHCRALLGSRSSAVQRRLNRAQMAYLAYMASDPRHWSFERGYCSGNPNMTVTRVCNIGQFGLLLDGHPRAAEWYEYASRWIKYWMENTVTEKGYWPESAHYTEVSMYAMRDFASASGGRPGYRLAEDPKYREMQVMYSGKLSVPTGQMVPYGRGIGCSLGGVPLKTWGSEHIPHFGFVFRSHAGTGNDNFLMYVPYRAQCADGEIWPHQVGSIASWYSEGKPVAGWHPGAGTGADRAFMPHVSLEGMDKDCAFSDSRLNGFAILPAVDYISSSYAFAGVPGGPVWACHCGKCPRELKPYPGTRERYALTTRLMFVHGGDSFPGSYLVLRDDLQTKQASTWSFPRANDALEICSVSPAAGEGAGFVQRLSGEGYYYNVLVPRSSAGVESSVQGEGPVVRLTGLFGTDYVFISDQQGEQVESGKISFKCDAGAVMDRKEGLSVNLLSGGFIKFKGYKVSADLPLAARIGDKIIDVSLSEPWGGGTIEIEAPGEWILDKADGCLLEKAEDGGVKVSAGEGVKAFRLKKK